VIQIDTRLYGITSKYSSPCLRRPRARLLGLRQREEQNVRWTRHPVRGMKPLFEVVRLVDFGWHFACSATEEGRVYSFGVFDAPKTRTLLHKLTQQG
jgi:hypothetical protein